MFETLFSYRSVLHRHCEGPLAAERAKYLKSLAAQHMTRNTILRHARYALCVSEFLCRQSLEGILDVGQVRLLACRWARERVSKGRASTSHWPAENFRSVATDFLRSCGRLKPPIPPSEKYDEKIVDFISAQRKIRWNSTVTCQNADWQVRQLLNYLRQRNVTLEEVTPDNVDAYFQHMTSKWSRVSLRTCAKVLRAWFSHCEKRGWTQIGLAGAVLSPRLYRDEGLPLGPTWEEVELMMDKVTGENATSRRDYAILQLLTVYGVRSGEVRRLRLDDIDWVEGRIQIERSKSGKRQLFPLNPLVGNAIAQYLCHSRPKSNRREVFLRLRAPHTPLSSGGLYNVVHHYLSKVSSLRKGCGPHGLRHACARHLLESGSSLKEIGDYLGHRSPDSTRVYAKVNLVKLRKVAFRNLGDLI